MKIVYNPKDGAPIKDMFAQRIYEIPANSMMRFDDNQVALYLLGKFLFLREISPNDVVKIEREIEEARTQKTKTAEEIHEEEMEKLTPKQKEAISKMPIAKPVGVIKIVNKKQKVLSPEEVEGIPESGKKDKDGVEWTGEGLEADNLAGMKTVIPGTPGTF